MHYRMIFRSTEPDAEADFGHIHGYIHVDAEGGYPKALIAPTSSGIRRGLILLWQHPNRIGFPFDVLRKDEQARCSDPRNERHNAYTEILHREPIYYMLRGE
jgi:hypothetical protein